MKRLIVVDSCAELDDEMLGESEIKRANFFIDVEDKSFSSGPDADLDGLLKSMKESNEPARSAAPTPDSFYGPARGYDEVFFVTISSKLSTTYNSAHIAKTMLEDENDQVKAHVFDSKSASVGESLVVMWIQEAMKEGLDFEEIVERVEEKIKSINTIFVLEDLDNMIKNGRMSKVAGFIASALSIYPVCIGVDGEIQVKSKPRGSKAAVKEMIQTIGEFTEDTSDKTLFISHVNNKERAEIVKELVEKEYTFKEIRIYEGSALTVTYANDQGVILAY